MKYKSYRPQSRLRSLFLRVSAPLFAMIMLSLSAQSAHAGSATWKSSPVNNQWYNANNWTPATVPDGATDIATFGTTTQPAITISDSSDFLTVLNAITFNPGASVYILTVPSTGQDLTFQDGGVINNSGQTQNFVIGAATVGSTVLTFQDATAGNDVTYNLGASDTLIFTGLSSGGSASFTCANNTAVSFTQGATAENATFTLNGTSHVDFFSGGSSAGNGTFVLNGDPGSAAVNFGLSGTSPGNAACILNGTATGSFGNRVYFSGFNDPPGSAAVFTANGAVDTSHNAGLVELNGADPGGATYIANAGSGGGSGGLLSWNTTTANRARVEVFGSGNGDITNGTLDATVFSGVNRSVGSLEGTGLVELGQNTLAVGSNNRSTTFSGIINDAGGGTNGSGSLTKTGTGTFTLSQANTYTGKTTVAAGTLLVTNRTGSATGTGPVIANGGVLGGTGKISGAVTLGSTTRFGTISPGLVGRTGRLTIFSTISFKQFGIYNADLDSTRVTADQVVATGVTIGSGATANIADLGTGTLSSGTVFTIINNASAIPVSGTFSNLADGSTLTVGSNTYLVSYEGGTGNDLTLTVQ